ncbi:MAG TPA: hypothetical protein VGB60_04250 [Brevundimonas sp.]|uniref:hypothetical protein n=1 Tax=Brevundimonas sp. TaxID=1871086 RepID=UPI002ED870D0
MTLHPLPLAALSVLALTGCATAPPTPSLLASDREVVAHVRANWSEHVARMAFLSGRRGQTPVLISVSKVECAPTGFNSACTFDVRARFDDGAVLTRSVDSEFQRGADGSIAKVFPVVVVYR